MWTSNYVYGDHTFLKFWAYCGPLLGPLEVKCTGAEYEGPIVKRFEDYLKQIPGFRDAVAIRNEMEKENRNKRI